MPISAITQTPHERAAQPGCPHVRFWLLATVKELRQTQRQKQETKQNKTKHGGMVDVGTPKLEGAHMGGAKHFLSCRFGVCVCVCFITYAKHQLGQTNPSTADH